MKRSVSGGEVARKAVHVSMGAFALLLKSLTWQQAATAAGAALAFNLFLLPSLGGRKIHKPGEENQRWSPGVALYPFTVLVLVLLFRHRLEIAAAAWGLLAIGDASASLVGRTLESERLPWNLEKSWGGLGAFVIFGGTAAGWLVLWVRPGYYSGPEMIALAFGGALVAGLVESLPMKLDDNVTAPLAGAIFMAALARTFDGPDEWALLVTHEKLHWMTIAAGVNLAIAAAWAVFRLLQPSGVVAGFLIGTAILFFGGWPAYAVLWTFFFLGTAATKWKYKEKARIGAAQAREGRRGAEHALANCAAGAIFLGLAAGAGKRPDLELFRHLLTIGFVAAFATALADTLGSELGSAYGRNPRLITNGKRVPPGTDGAVSLPGTLGGIAGAAFVAGVAVQLHLLGPKTIVPIVLGAIAGTTVESILGATLEKRKLIDNEVQNFLNTLVGALAAIGAARALGA